MAFGPFARTNGAQGLTGQNLLQAANKITLNPKTPAIA